MNWTKHCTHSKTWFINPKIKQPFWVTHYFQDGYKYYPNGRTTRKVKDKINKDITLIKHGQR